MKRLQLLVLTILVSVSSVFTIYGQGQGQLWGTTVKGGKGGGGTIYSTNADGNSYYKIRHEFTPDVKGKQPIGTLVKATNGKYYGITAAGGAMDMGVIYEFDINTSEIKTLHEFSTGDPYVGGIGGMIQASDGKLYGLTYKGGSEYSGTIYSWDIATSTFTNEFTFIPGKTGVVPVGELIEVAPLVFCGVTQGGNTHVNGIIFQWDKGANDYKILKDFAGGNDGIEPVGGLTKGNDGLLYGMCRFGGANSRGLFFSFDRTTKAYNVIHEFTTDEDIPYNKVMLSSNGNIYGTTYNSVFKYSGGTFTTLDIINDATNKVGANGLAGLFEASNGKLYTMFQRINEIGVAVVEYDRDTGLPTLKGSSDVTQGFIFAGAQTFVEGPGGQLLAGLRNGASTGNGGLISYSAGTVTKLKDFGDGISGSDPWGDLCRVGNKLYGMVASGGANGWGYIYEIDAMTENFVVKHHFTGADGGRAMGGLMLATNGKLYGMTTFGGPSNDRRYFSIPTVTEIAASKGHGVIFEFDPANGTYTKLADLSPSVGTNPWGKLMQASDGNLYGLTSYDGANNGGTLFQYVIGGAITKKYDLPNAGSFITANFGPRGTLTESGGKLYGMTPRGGTNNAGIIFEYDLTGGSTVVKVNFSAKTDASASATGSEPRSSLTLHPNGKMYGITSAAGPDRPSGFGGTIFEYVPGATTVTVKNVLETALWTTTRDLTVGSGVNMYGNGTSMQVSNNVAFEFRPETGEVKIKYTTSGPNGAMVAYGAMTYVPGKSGQTVEFPTSNFFVMDQRTITLPKFSTANIEAVYESSDLNKATVSGNIATMKAIGDVTFTATAPGNSDFEPAPPANFKAKILKGQQIITFADFTATYGDGTITLPATTTSDQPIVYTCTDIDRVSIDGDKLTILRAGTVSIVASQSGNDNWYPASSMLAKLTIDKADQAITFGEMEKGKVGTLFTPPATSSSGLPVVFKSQNLSIAIIENNKVKPLAPGTVGIVATQPGDDNYNAAADVVRTLTIEKGPQVITLKEIPAKTVGDQFTPEVTSTSGLTVFTYTTSSELTWESGSSVIKVVSPGVATLTAKQAGNDSWAEATASRTFCANPKKPTISMSVSGTALTLNSSNPDGNVWKKDGAVITGATSSSISAELGVYSVTSTVEGCASQPSDDYVVSITGDIGETNTVEIYPNPASDKLYVRVPGNRGSKLSIISSDGRALNELNFSEESIEISLEGRSPGLYFLRLNNQIIKFLKK
ncbi:MAG TPA: choice-of-anchor tandem repeat GloVer-containing protein [Cyclobacteriaceae bacterium]|nr:choice-of-anchor tandem repeat GloVer-containing protein [Cyclobacteriaceae bacterium]